MVEFEDKEAEVKLVDDDDAFETKELCFSVVDELWGSVTFDGFE